MDGTLQKLTKYLNPDTDLKRELLQCVLSWHPGLGHDFHVPGGGLKNTKHKMY